MQLGQCLPSLIVATSSHPLYIAELRAMQIGMRTSLGKLDLLAYCPLTGRYPHCKSALITANSVGKRKLCYATPWPKTIVGIDMRCTSCKHHFMTHDPTYIDTLPLSAQLQREFVSTKGNRTHISLIEMMRSGLSVSQVERCVEGHQSFIYPPSLAQLSDVQTVLFFPLYTSRYTRR